jgi:hypothetical protein
MAKVLLVNVGANTANQHRARSPLFDNGSFIYVSFPDAGCRRPYPKEAQPYVSDPVKFRTHLDPDWHNLTYGDCCHNPRARALLGAEVGDILLFWGLLWKNPKKGANIWDSTAKRWCLFGAMRIEVILESHQTITHLTPGQRKRVVENDHMVSKRVEGRPMARFLWCSGQRLLRPTTLAPRVDGFRIASRTGLKLQF